MMKAESPVLLACLPASAGDTCGPVVSVEGVATNDNAFIRYSVLDGEGETIKTVTRHFRVAVESAITLDAMTCGGGALVVKRPTDPARFNCATGTVQVSGAGADGLVLEGAKVLFEPSGNGSMRVNGGSSFTFYGVTPSETMNDASISLKTIGGETLVSTNLTVLWVDISMRCGQGESLSPDNGLIAGLSPNMLGVCQMITNLCFYDNGFWNKRADTMGNVAEFVGRVFPVDFIDCLVMNRIVVGSFLGTSAIGSFSIATNICTTCVPWIGDPRVVNDTSPQESRDDNPAPLGCIYDVDHPGICIDAQAGAGGMTYPYGTVVFLRDNFIEYATIRGLRCSNDFRWHNRTTVRKTSHSGAELSFEFLNRANHGTDNSIGPGHTSISANED